MTEEEKEICIGRRSGKTYNKIQEMAKEIVRLQKELEEKTTILMAGAEKVKQLEKENTELKDNQLWSEATIEWLKERFIPKEKVDAEIKELEENEDFYREQGRMYEYEGKINLLKRLLAKE